MGTYRSAADPAALPVTFEDGDTNVGTGNNWMLLRNDISGLTQADPICARFPAGHAGRYTITGTVRYAAGGSSAPDLIGTFPFDTDCAVLIDDARSLLVVRYDAGPETRIYRYSFPDLEEQGYALWNTSLDNYNGPDMIRFAADNDGNIYSWEIEDDANKLLKQTYADGGAAMAGEWLVTEPWDDDHREYLIGFNQYDGYLYDLVHGLGFSGPIRRIDPDTGTVTELTSALTAPDFWPMLTFTPDGAVWLFNDDTGTGVYRYLDGTLDQVNGLGVLTCAPLPQPDNSVLVSDDTGVGFVQVFSDLTTGIVPTTWFRPRAVASSHTGAYVALHSSSDDRLRGSAQTVSMKLRAREQFTNTTVTEETVVASIGVNGTTVEATFDEFSASDTSPLDIVLITDADCGGSIVDARLSIDELVLAGWRINAV